MVSTRSHAQVISPGSPVAVDGVIGEGEWDQALEIQLSNDASGFRENVIAADRKTRIRLKSAQDTPYVLIEADDPHPEKINYQQSFRDKSDNEDRVAFG